MKRSPLRIIEFCLYVLIIIAAIIYVAVTGNKPTPFDTAQIVTTTELTLYSIVQDFTV